MAVTDLTLLSSREQSLSAADVEKLADRLYARGSSVLGTAAPNLAGDLVTASRVIRRLLGVVDRLAVIVGDRTRSTANLVIKIGG